MHHQMNAGILLLCIFSVDGNLDGNLKTFNETVEWENVTVNYSLTSITATTLFLSSTKALPTSSTKISSTSSASSSGFYHVDCSKDTSYSPMFEISTVIFTVDPNYHVQLNISLYFAPLDDVAYLYDGLVSNSPILASLGNGNNWFPRIESTGTSMRLELTAKNTIFRGNCTQKLPDPRFRSSCSPRYLYATDTGSISTKDFTGPWTSCIYYIYVPSDSSSHVLLKFDHMTITGLSSSNTYIEVYDEEPDISTIGRYTTVPRSIVANSRYMAVVIKESSLNVLSFSLSYSAIKDACKCPKNPPAGTLRIPEDPSRQYCNNMYCSYNMSTRYDCKLSIRILSLELGKGDFLRIGRTENDVLVRFGEHDRAGSVIHARSEGDSMTVSFSADANYVGNGFELEYESICNDKTTNKPTTTTTTEKSGVVVTATSAVCAIVGFLIVLCCCYYWCCKRKRQRRVAEAAESATDQNTTSPSIANTNNEARQSDREIAIILQRAEYRIHALTNIGPSDARAAPSAPPMSQGSPNVAARGVIYNQAFEGPPPPPPYHENPPSYEAVINDRPVVR